MDSEFSAATSSNPYTLLFSAFSIIPFSHYCVAFFFLLFVFIYNLLEFHFFQDLLTFFNGSPVVVTFNSSSPIYDNVVSKCKLLHGRYLATPWLSSPHLQTWFLNFHGRAPVVKYRRRLFHTPDGGIISLDWLMSSDVLDRSLHTNDAVVDKDDVSPLVVVIPGLTSDSSSAYIKHFAFVTARHGWNVVISNHRGLGGVSVMSDCFYNAGWTEDTRVVIDHLHHKYPKAPLFLVGTSVGANILVKYLGEHGEHVPVAGAVAVCSPWDLLLGDRFINRTFVQNLYNRVLANGLQCYAELHQTRFTRLANWEGIKKSHSVRDFDSHATCLVGKYESVDTYYRHSSSANYVGSVSVPLLCINALDDPVCTREAIPWDECRLNKNIVLATTHHGGHLAFFEGIAATSLWWVNASLEFLNILHSTQYMHVQKMESPTPSNVWQSNVDQGPYVNVSADGMVIAMGNEQASDDVEELPVEKSVPSSELHEEPAGQMDDEPADESVGGLQTSGQVGGAQDAKLDEVLSPLNRCLSQLRRQSRWSILLLAYVAIITSLPFACSALQIVLGKKFRDVLRGRLFK